MHRTPSVMANESEITSTVGHTYASFCRVSLWVLCCSARASCGYEHSLEEFTTTFWEGRVITWAICRS